MKKGFLIVALCSIIGYLCGYGYVNASSEVLSNSYTSLSQCTLDKDKFNTEFPDYVRSSCFLKEGNYYYTLCQKGSTCTTQSNSASLDYTLGNPYSSNISSSLKVKLDTVITALENKKKTENPSIMNGYLDTFLVKINSLKVKYNGKTAILDMLAYLEYETNRIKSELQQGSDENSTSDFFCDLMGECKTSTVGSTNNTTTVGPTPASVPTEPQSYVNNRPPVVSNTQSFGTLNGGVCRGEVVYVNTIGVNKSNPPKGCASPASSNDCLQVSNHRSFENSEWTTNGIITTSLHTKDIPAGEYSFYTSYGNIVKKTGTVKVNSCAASKYTWSCIVPGPVNVNTSGNICNASNVGEYKKISNYDCTCAFNGSGNYDSTVSIPTTPVVTPAPSPSPTPVVTPNPNPNVGQSTCDGSLPTGAGVESSPYTNVLFGGYTSNTTWMYEDDARNINKMGCTWRCTAGYTKSGTSCIQKASGSGLKIEVVDLAGKPVSGVNIEVIGSILSAGSLVLASVTTDVNGTVPEIFVNKFGVLQLLKITKAGYTIADASGCSDRVTSGINYCDGVVLENSSIKIYLSDGIVDRLAVTPLSGTMYVSQKNSLTYNASGLTQTNGQFCLEVRAHTQQYQSVINTGNCNNAANYESFSEFPGATYSNGIWTLPVPYNESIFGVEGIQVRVFVKNTSTGNVVSFDLFTKN